MKKLTIFYFVCAILFTLCFTSCQKEDANINSFDKTAKTFNQDDVNIEIMKLDSLNEPTRINYFNESDWGSFNRLYNSSSNRTISAGTYAVKITCNSNLTLNIDAENFVNTPTPSNTWAYIFDNQANQIYFSGVLDLESCVFHHYQYSITSSESLVLILHVKQTGTFRFYYY